MTGRRLALAFLLALLISGGCTYLLSRSARRNGAAVRTVEYVAAAVPLQAGEALRPESLKMIRWPASLPLPGAFANPKQLAGRAVLYPLQPGQPILARDLAIPGMGLTMKIPDGMRAVALRSDEVVGVAGFLFPGSHVDVLVTCRTGQSAEPGTATVLEDAEVLAAGHQVEPDPDGKPNTVNVVTLLMTPRDAERVVLASTQGTIHFVLRNSNDTSKVNGAPVELSSLLPSSAAPQDVSHPHRVPARPYVVETILGNTQSAARFNQADGSRLP
jgi:pilus assembly protein CpaB